MANDTRQKDDPTRAAIMAALLAGQRVTEVAQQFQVSKATVSRIKATIDHDTLKQIETKKGEDFGELLGDYLRETLITLSEQTIFFRNEEWLKQQTAADVAVLHGVAADKAIRLLEAIEQANGHSAEEV